MESVIRNIRGGMRELGQGVVMDLNGTPTLVWSYPIVMIGDMPQQSDSAGFMRSNAYRGCRACQILSVDRADLHFDTEKHGRYHYDIICLRKEGKRLSEEDQDRFFKRHSMHRDPPAVTQIAPALCYRLGRAYDLPHSEWQGIGKVVYTLLVKDILSNEGCKRFIRAMQEFPFPPDWNRIQSPLHLFSWSLAEAGRALILLPLILRSKCHQSWFQVNFLLALQARLQSDSLLEGCRTPVEGLICIFNVIAKSTSKTGSFHSKLTEAEAQQALLRSREAVHLLIDCIEAKGPARGSNALRELIHQEEEADDDDMAGPGTLLDLLEREMEAGDDGNDSGYDEPGNDDTDEENESPEPDPDPPGPDDPAAAPRRRLTRWEKLRRLPNIHVGLHLADNVLEYGHAMNGNVLVGELKHKMWKLWAHSSGSGNLMAYLWAKCNAKQSTHLIFSSSTIHGAFGDSWAAVQEQCPLLTTSFLPKSDRVQDFDLGDEESIDIHPGRGVLLSVKVSSKGFILDRSSAQSLQLPTNGEVRLCAVERTRAFYIGLAYVFQRDYQLRNMRFMPRDKVFWFQSLFYSSANLTQQALRAGEYVHMENGQICCLEQIGIVLFQRRKYLILIVQKLELLPFMDPILGNKIYQTSGLDICGLSSISDQKEYLIEAPTNGPWNENAQADEAFFMGCDWRLDYM